MRATLVASLILILFGLPQAQAESASSSKIKALAQAKEKLRLGLSNDDRRAVAEAENSLDGLCREGLAQSCHLLGAYELSLGKITQARAALTAGCKRKDEGSCLELANYYSDHRQATERAAWLKEACQMSELERPCRLSRDSEALEKARAESPKPIQK